MGIWAGAANLLFYFVLIGFIIKLFSYTLFNSQGCLLPFGGGWESPRKLATGRIDAVNEKIKLLLECTISKYKVGDDILVYSVLQTLPLLWNVRN